jgi:hypothetical protein
MVSTHTPSARALTSGMRFAGIHHHHSRQATLHAASSHVQVHTPSHSSPRSPRTWVSAGTGSTPACHCRSPYPLNSQYQPPTGRR